MPLVQTRGAASAQGFGEFAQASAVPNYIEEVFSCFLYTGNGSTQTITNGIDLSTKGGMSMFKVRSNTYDWQVFDTARGATNFLSTNTTSGNGVNTDSLTAFNTNGFNLGNAWTNDSGEKYASWSFRKQPKYFDIQTWTGNATNRTIAHSLGAVPGSIWVKRTDSNASWQVYHRSLANTQYLVLNGTGAVATDATLWNSTTPTSAVFSIGTSTNVNASAGTYVAYIFAHDAGGFGLTGTDNVISCGTFTTDGSGNGSATLGYEPQWLLIKRTDSTGNWFMLDTMRGLLASTEASAKLLRANTSDAEFTGSYALLNATGFSVAGGLSTSATYIYIAIRRGPMKVPTSGTSVFSPNAYTGSGSSQSVTTNFPVDLNITKRRTAVSPIQVTDRLRGSSTTFYNYLRTNATDAETSGSTYGFGLDNNTGYVDNLFSTLNSGSDIIGWNFKRAPSFFDEVCYTGTGSTRTVTHNLGVTPELVITKSRSQALGWVVWTTSLTSTDYWIRLDDTMAQANSPVGYGGTFSASTYTIANTGPYDALNNSGSTYVAYLFATCAGVSKVGSYTGTATTLQIDCGFTAGARFVLIKRTDSTGAWYVWDTARGIVSGNDPYLLLNTTDAEVTSTDYIDTYSAGFEISSTAPAAINASGGTFIFLAIA